MVSSIFWRMFGTDLVKEEIMSLKLSQFAPTCVVTSRIKIKSKVLIFTKRRGRILFPAVIKVKSIEITSIST